MVKIANLEACQPIEPCIETSLSIIIPYQLTDPNQLTDFYSTGTFLMIFNDPAKLKMWHIN